MSVASDVLESNVVPPPSEREGRVELAAAHHISLLDGLTEATWNHYSLIVSDGEGDAKRMLITPGDRHWSRVTASSLASVGEDAEAARAKGGVFWIGYRIHFPVHEARPDAHCMLHAHPRYTTALSLLGPGALLPVSQQSLNIYERVTYNDRYDGLEGDSEAQGHAIAEALGDKDVLVLKGHGVFVVAPTVAEAYHDLFLLEVAARTQILAMSTGAKLTPFTDDEVRKLYNPRGGIARSIANQQFRAMREVLDDQGSIYAN
jgi:ribulose-5-phosphate 4-epimerase/fuculose-1-phosphate aldolase